MANGLLLLHGFPLDGSMWDEQVAEFAPLLTVLAPDMPGFGSAPGSLTSMNVAADAAAAALRAAGVDRAIVCGLSMGGYIALALWRRHPGLVAGIVLANTKAGPDDEAGKERRRQLAARLRKEGNSFLAANPPPLFSDAAPPALWEAAKAAIARQSPAAIAAGAEAMADRPDSTPNLTTIDVPVMFVTSELDTLIPPAETWAMAKHLPGERVAVIKGAGHLSNLEQPEQFNQLLREHLVRCRLAELAPLQDQA
ncbi:hypothetical protein AYO38_02165 [bacterium SCGC AG-212-C10]|nr:hypothetical protein AYO38_02165 [bacterium SCGC AG-212-C10]